MYSSMDLLSTPTKVRFENDLIKACLDWDDELLSMNMDSGTTFTGLVVYSDTVYVPLQH